MSELDAETIEAFKDHKLDERARIVTAREAGQPIRDVRGCPRRTLSNGSINKLLILLGAILSNARRRGLIDANPVDDVDRLATRRSKGDILEADELESLIEGAGDLTGRAGSTDVDERFDAVRRLRDEQQLPWKAIARALGIAESTAIYRYQRAGRPAPTGVADPGRRALIATLGCAGLRVSELAGLDLADIDLAHRKIRVTDAKTEAGIRTVDVTERLAGELRSYLGTRTAEPANAPAFPTRMGNRRDKDNIRNRVLAPALRRANELRERRGLPPIDARVTLHTLRRTCISIMFGAGADVPYVPGAGRPHRPRPHPEDLRDGAQPPQPPPVLRRVRRAHARRDSVHAARQHADRPAAQAGRIRPRTAADTIQFGPDIGPEVRSRMIRRASHTHPPTKESSPERGFCEVELGGLEPPTSWVRSRRSPN